MDNLGIKHKGYTSFRKKLLAEKTQSEQVVDLLNENGKQVSGPRMLINEGQDDQMEICGYKSSPLKTFLTYVFILLTGGLLRLFFHWLPHLYLKAKCHPCEVTSAQYVLITEIYNKKHKIYHVKRLKVLTAKSVQDEKASDVRVAEDGCKTDDFGTLSVNFEGGAFREVAFLLSFTCKKVTYIWDQEKKIFSKLHGLDDGVSSQDLHQNKGLTKNEQYIRRAVYGANEIKVKESTISELLFLEVLNPFYIFQMFSFILWFADNYYYYAAAILIMSLFGVVMTVMQTRKNQKNLKSSVHSSDVASVLRRNENYADSSYSLQTNTSEVISTELLVPGDILEIPSHGCILQCDAILLTGNCILNESMLTGESVPVTKTPFPNIPNLIYDPKEHGRHTLFCGTQVIQTRYFDNEKVLAVVIRTGFSTAKGGLVRSILYPPPVDFRFEKDSYRFILLLAAIAGVGFVGTIITKAMRGVGFRDLLLNAFDLITIVVPPALPAAMTVGRFYAQTRLQRNKIFCISPRSINVSGSIDCVCFDKTGTLTEDGLDLLCVVPIESNSFLLPVTDVESMPYNVFVCGLVSCHSLTIIDKKITGDPLDVKMFESTKWSIEDPEISDNTKFNTIFPTVLKPPKKAENANFDEDLQIGIIREFPFSSSAQRMGVIIRKLGAQNFEYYSKGSPEMILNFVTRESVPDNFSEVLERYTQEGYRVIALAHKELKLSYMKAQRVQREAIEHGMTLLGLIVLENRLKEDTTPCIQVLNNAQIRCIMVTGDNILTAVSVGRDCGIIRMEESVITVNIDSSTNEVCYSLTAIKRNKSKDAGILSNSSSLASLETIESQIVGNGAIIDDTVGDNCNNYRFAMTGKVWASVRSEHPELIPKLVTRGTIFARMSPDQKQQLVQELQSLGYYVAMCGDGANDCGALKAAHTGISLSDAESSVASPFTSKNPNITCVLNIIKEGRAALVTSFGIFKYMASYSLCQFISVMILYSIDSNLTDFEFLYIDLFIISVFAFFFGRTEAYKGKLVKETPLNSLISLSPILSLILQLVLVIFFQALPLVHLRQQSWYVPFNATASSEHSVGCVENYAVFTVSGFQYIILAIVYSTGKPYRESIFTNCGLLGSAVLMTLFSVYLAISPMAIIQEYFELVLPKDHTYRFYLLLYAALNFLLSMFVEFVIVDHCVFKKLRFRFHNVSKSKRKYLAIEKDLDKDRKWPPLTLNYCTAASPSAPVPKAEAEIVIEMEKFEKNHVLNGFYQNGGVGYELSLPNSAKSTPTYNPSKGGVSKFSGKSLDNGIDDNLETFTSSEFQSAVAFMSSDASFKTAEMAASSYPNTPRKIPNGGGGTASSNPTMARQDLNENILKNKRMRSLSGNYDANASESLKGRKRRISAGPGSDYSCLNDVEEGTSVITKSNLEMNELEGR